MKTLHTIEDPGAARPGPENLQEWIEQWFADVDGQRRYLGNYTRRYLEDLYGPRLDVEVRLTRLMEGLMRAGFRPGDVALPVTREELRVFRVNFRPVEGGYRLDTYRGWPLAVVE